MEASVLIVSILVILLLWAIVSRHQRPGREFPDVPLQRIQEMADRLQFQTKTVESGVVLTRGDQEYILEIIPRKMGANTPSVSGTVLLTTERPGPLPFPVRLPPSDPFVVRLNQQTALTAWIPGEEGAVLGISRVTYHKDNPEQWDLYIPLLLFAAASEPSIYRSVLSSLIGEDSSTTPAAARETKPSPTAFVLAGKILEQAGLHVTTDERGLTAEIPWRGDVGVESADADTTKTSRLTLSAERVHPVIGAGTACELRLPLSLAGEEAANAAFFLNLKEMAADDAPPLFGAWSAAPDTGLLVFRGFVPSPLWPSVSPSNLAVWSRYRSDLAAGWIQEWNEDKADK